MLEIAGNDAMPICPLLRKFNETDNSRSRIPVAYAYLASNYLAQNLVIYKNLKYLLELFGYFRCYGLFAFWTNKSRM